jgi:hypothetical protein
MRGWWGRLGPRARLAILGPIALLFGIALATAPPQQGGNAKGRPPALTGAATDSPSPIIKPVVSATASPVLIVPSTTPEATAEATPGPTPEPTPTPVATPQEAFAPITLKGRGSKVPRFKIPEGVAAIAKITEHGTSNFVVQTVDATGDTPDLLVNEIGSYSGTVIFDVESGSHSVAFKVESNGTWTIVILPVTRARTWNTSVRLTGKGDDVVQLAVPIGGFATTSVVHSGRSNFVVYSYTDSNRDLLINEIGKYNGEIQLPDGTVLIVVEADGSWSFTPPA